MRNASDRAFFTPSLDVLRREFDQALNSVRREFVELSQGLVHRDVFSVALHELKNQARNDVISLQSDLESSVVKAGYLSIAVSDCTQEERMQVFGMLKRRESEILGQASNFVTPGSISALKDFRFLQARSAPEGASHQPIPSTSQGPEDVVALQRRPGSKLGLSLDGSSGGSLLIEKVAPDGDVAFWNSMNQSRALRAGDVIVAVNNVRDRPAALIEQTHHPDSNGVLLLTVVRASTAPSPTQQSVSPDVVPSPRAPEAPVVSIPQAPVAPMFEVPPLDEEPQPPKDTMNQPDLLTPELEAKVAKQIKVKVVSSRGQKMGVGLDSEDGKTLKITKISPGLIEEWNIANPTSIVAIGDLIVSVNGRSDTSNVLVEEIQKGGELQLVVAKPA